ncbi:hypothetical protein GCM10020331_045600 [Ectobacillus funiculus]
MELIRKSDISATDIEMTGAGTSFTLVTPFDSVRVTMKLAGKFNVYNVLAAAAACLVSNVPLETIVRVIERMQGVSGRFELVDGDQDFCCYCGLLAYAGQPRKCIANHSPVRNGQGVLCCWLRGDRDRTKRPEMARIAAQYADCPIFTSDNPRSEDPLAILDEMAAGVTGEQYEILPDRKEAITRAVSAAKRGDVVLIAGKGHETYQIIGTTVIDFDDRLVAKEAMKHRSSTQQDS